MAENETSTPPADTLPANTQPVDAPPARTPPLRGQCPRCKQPNSYGKLTCDYCGERLPWADYFATNLGENCFQCGHFNTYTLAACAACGVQLPWHDAPAARRFAANTGEKEQKSLGLVIGLCIVGVILFLGLMFYFLTPVKY